MSTARPGSAGYIYRHGWIPVAGTGAVDKRSKAKQLANPSAPPNPEHADKASPPRKNSAEVDVQVGGKANTFERVGPDESVNGDWRVEDSAQERGIKDYTGSTYEWVNYSLRNGEEEIPTEETRKLVGFTTSRLDGAFAAAPPLTRNISVSRFIDGDGPFPPQPPLMEPGGVFEDAAYVSTTKKDKLPGFGTTSMEIRVPAGSKAIDVEHAAKTDFPEEREVLLPRGTKFRVVNDEIKKGSDGRSSRHIVVEVV